MKTRSTSRLSIEENLSPEQQGCSSAGVFPGQASPAIQYPWQQAGGCPVPNLQGNNNNLNYLPCGSSQCDTEQTMRNHRNSLQAFAMHHEMPMDDFQGYKPELNPNQNPHYYHINSVLYSAHLEKASRQGSGLKQ